MKVLVYGAGRFGRVTAAVFAEHEPVFTDVALSDPSPRSLRRLPAGTRPAKHLESEDPDIVVLAASAVPRSARDRLLRSLAPIEAFWALERKANLRLMRQIFPWLRFANWKLLVVATNPVDDWTNALDSLLMPRKVVGLGTAFDNARVRFLAAAQCPGREIALLRRLRVVGAHGAVIGLGGPVKPEIVETARWMSNALSVAFLKAPELYAATWWREVALRPLVRGLAGVSTRTHLVVPLTYGSVRTALGVDTRVRGLEIRHRPIRELRDAEQRQLLKHVTAVRRTRGALARAIASQSTR